MTKFSLFGELSL